MTGVGSKVTNSHLTSSPTEEVASASFPSAPAKKAVESTLELGKSPVEAERETSRVLERETSPLGEISETV